MEDNLSRLNILCFVKERVNILYSGFFRDPSYTVNLDIVNETERGIKEFIEKAYTGFPYNLVLIDYKLESLSPAKKIREIDTKVSIIFFPSFSISCSVRLEAEVDGLGSSVLEEEFYRFDFKDVIYPHLFNNKN